MCADKTEVEILSRNQLLRRLLCLALSAALDCSRSCCPIGVDNDESSSGTPSTVASQTTEVLQLATWCLSDSASDPRSQLEAYQKLEASLHDDVQRIEEGSVDCCSDKHLVLDLLGRAKENVATLIKWQRKMLQAGVELSQQRDIRNRMKEVLVEMEYNVTAIESLKAQSFGEASQSPKGKTARNDGNSMTNHMRKASYLSLENALEQLGPVAVSQSIRQSYDQLPEPKPTMVRRMAKHVRQTDYSKRARAFTVAPSLQFLLLCQRHASRSSQGPAAAASLSFDLLCAPFLAAKNMM